MSLVLVAVMAACGQKATTGSEKGLAEIDLMLDWYPNAVHSYLYVAEEKGYFEEEGIKVNIQFPANPTDPINLAAAGQITLGISYQPDVVIARANQDVPVKSVGAIVRSPLNHVVLLNDSPVKTPKDLEGKTVGFPGIPLNEALLKTMVKNDGGNPDNVTMIDVGFELGTSIVSGRVDGVIGAYINHEVPVLKHKGYDTRYFNPVDYGVPSFYELVVVTNDNTWNERQKDIEAFWRAATKGYEFMKANPDEALSILLSNQDKANFPLIEEVEKESLQILLPKMESANGFGSQDESSWQETIDWMIEFDLIKKEPRLEDIFVNIVK
ncbi:ABC transporter substrate-binding protein [Anaerobacillus alkaliphilus]|uniref:ABC transporter substrate-binding protein n=2 Tax=Anaerobacillus alkaliphilus TaxID=1548597 RepID=A0A4Q0VKU8_9BACI|nr:ABC transporter substrate-binding protein [Anaerobacillus alkaliphilus]RXI95584.1 ABC transporter substrate-binding protein [Anaerobacillus alkaliphilus]